MRFHRIHLNNEPALREEIRQLVAQLKDEQMLGVFRGQEITNLERENKELNDAIRVLKEENVHLGNEAESERMRRLTHDENCPKRKGW